MLGGSHRAHGSHSAEGLVWRGGAHGLHGTEGLMAYAARRDLRLAEHGGACGLRSVVARGSKLLTHGRSESRVISHTGPLVYI